MRVSKKNTWMPIIKSLVITQSVLGIVHLKNLNFFNRRVDEIVDDGVSVINIAGTGFLSRMCRPAGNSIW